LCVAIGWLCVDNCLDFVFVIFYYISDKRYCRSSVEYRGKFIGQVSKVSLIDQRTQLHLHQFTEVSS